MGRRKDPAAVALGRKGGKAPRKGPIGFARLTKAERKAAAKSAAEARWAKAGKSKPKPATRRRA